jgi:hypothetical protein
MLFLTTKVTKEAHPRSLLTTKKVKVPTLSRKERGPRMGHPWELTRKSYERPEWSYNAAVCLA